MKIFFDGELIYGNKIRKEAYAPHTPRELVDSSLDIIQELYNYTQDLLYEIEGLPKDEFPEAGKAVNRLEKILDLIDYIEKTLEDVKYDLHL